MTGVTTLVNIFEMFQLVSSSLSLFPFFWLKRRVSGTSGPVDERLDEGVSTKYGERSLSVSGTMS